MCGDAAPTCSRRADARGSTGSDLTSALVFFSLPHSLRGGHFPAS